MHYRPPSRHFRGIEKELVVIISFFFYLSLVEEHPGYNINNIYNTKSQSIYVKHFISINLRIFNLITQIKKYICMRI